MGANLPLMTPRVNGKAEPGLFGDRADENRGGMMYQADVVVTVIGHLKGKQGTGVN